MAELRLKKHLHEHIHNFKCEKNGKNLNILLRPGLREACHALNYHHQKIIVFSVADIGPTSRLLAFFAIALESSHLPNIGKRHSCMLYLLHAQRCRAREGYKERDHSASTYGTLQ